MLEDLLKQDTTEYLVEEDGTATEVTVEGDTDIDTTSSPGGGLNDLLGVNPDKEVELFDVEVAAEEGETEEESEEEAEEGSEESEEAKESEEDEADEVEVTAEDTIEVLTELGLDISVEDLEEAGGDSGKAVELHTYKKAQSIIDAAINSLPPGEKEAVSKLLDGSTLEELGLNSKPASAPEYSESEIEESEDIQKELIEAYYVEIKGLKPARAKALAETVGEDGFEEALESQKALAKAAKDRVEKPLAERKAIQKKAEEARQELIDNINSKAEDFFKKPAYNDLKLTKAISTKAKANLYANWEDINSNLPQYITILSALKEMGVLDGKVDKIAASAVTSKTKAITKMIKAKTKSTSTGGKKPKKEEDDTVSFITRALKANKKRF